MRAFPRPISLALALAVLPGLGHALGLGALRGEAFLGEPLRVEVQLIGDSPAPSGANAWPCSARSKRRMTAASHAT